ncbi:hypothetical protein ACFP4H_21460 [Pseudophaeobacter arcticus]|uniref:hypothetical protein n=1 Tax=Pseudophaeobacter arcticus TaxID=385492 RepID=UPI0012B63707|nr:hypothetical protein [Pseudophaeobacter arcticus]
MDYHLQDIDYVQNFQQGDIIQRDILENDVTNYQWGFVLNADCDIEQRKNSDRISWIEIIPAEEHIATRWAQRQLKDEVDKRAPALSDELNACIKRQDLGLEKLDKTDLISWLQEQSGREVADLVGINKEETIRRLEALALAVRATGSYLEELVQLREAFGSQRVKVLEAARKSLTTSDGFPDIIFVPGLPGFMEQGFVLRLRDIFSIEQRHVFQSYPDWKVRDEREGFFRTGRFSDQMRYQIVQKMAFLFLRIGAPEAYDNHCGQMAGKVFIEKEA